MLFTNLQLTYSKRIALLVVLFVVSVLIVSSVPKNIFAQSSELNQAQVDRAKLERELASLEAEIKQKEAELARQKGKSTTLSNDISKLKSQIDKSKLDIKAKNLTIQKLGGEINEKNERIGDLNEKIEREKESLAQLIRKTNDIDQSNVIHVILSEESLSEFYDDLNSFASIKSGIKKSVDAIRGIKTETETEKQLLQKKQDQEEDAKFAIEQAKKKVEQSQAEQAKLLAISKNKEKEYQAVLADRAKKVSEIRAKLFNFAGGSAAIPFGTALTYAEAAESATGVRAAFLLAILTQESNLGANVGKCYLTTPETGAGIRVSTGEKLASVMKPTRDVAPFLEITKKLGIDPYRQVVSCPIPGGGYGGGMGPSQFIPSTWKSIESRIGKALGTSVPNPWSPRDAFFASGIYLSDLGARAKTYTAERNAACRYYSGRICDARKPANSFYGNAVMAKVNAIQADIDYLKEYGVSRR